MKIETFDKNKLHKVPVILVDYALQLQNLGNSPEVRENYADRFEATRDYCNYVLDIHRQMKDEDFRSKKYSGNRAYKRA
jgi:hypothetical protein